MVGGLRIFERLLLGLWELPFVEIDGMGLLGRDARFAKTREPGEERLLSPLCG